MNIKNFQQNTNVRLLLYGNYYIDAIPTLLRTLENPLLIGIDDMTDFYAPFPVINEKAIPYIIADSIDGQQDAINETWEFLHSDGISCYQSILVDFVKHFDLDQEFINQKIAELCSLDIDIDICVFTEMDPRTTAEGYHFPDLVRIEKDFDYNDPDQAPRKTEEDFETAKKLSQLFTATFSLEKIPMLQDSYFDFVLRCWSDFEYAEEIDSAIFRNFGQKYLHFGGNFLFRKYEPANLNRIIQIIKGMDC